MMMSHRNHFNFVVPAALTTAGIVALIFYRWHYRKKSCVKEIPDASTPKKHMDDDQAVDLHGRPWAKLDSAQRAKWWADHNTSVEDEYAAAITAESPIVTPLNDEFDDLEITPETLPRWLTVVMTTSPVVSHPSTALIEEVVNSIGLVEFLQRVPKLIICDGYKVKDKSRFRSGEVTEERAAAYVEYKANLRALVGTHCTATAHAFSSETLV
jgi:hypothetical protein